MHTYINAYMNAYIYIYIYIYDVLMYTYINVYMNAYTLACIQLPIYLYTYIYTQTHTYIHIFSYYAKVTVVGQNMTKPFVNRYYKLSEVLWQEHIYQLLWMCLAKHCQSKLQCVIAKM